jgi:molybdopterin-guanine dinucleotide biosynthesis protein A
MNPHGRSEGGAAPRARHADGRAPDAGFVAPARATITGLVLAGGRGERMGGVDKGLQQYLGAPLIDHAVMRLAPQVHGVLISANRNIEFYATRAARVLVDSSDNYAGPLAGILAGLRAAPTPWLAVVPCDAPRLPLDLVARLAQAVDASAPSSGAVVERDHGADGRRLEPVCCLLSTALADDLARYLASGRRKVEPWVAAHAMPVAFDRPQDADAFTNLNTLAELDDRTP